jgi:uncharacterized repeat protein (TIGR02543 family)
VGGCDIGAFESQGFSLTTTVADSLGGTIQLDPAGGVYANGSVITLTALPDSGWQFDGWGGDLSGSTNPINLTMDGTKTITASFTASPVGESKVYLPLLVK